MAKVPGKTSKSVLRTWAVYHKWPAYVADGKTWQVACSKVTAHDVALYGAGEATFTDASGKFTAYVADVLMIEERKT